MSFERVNQMAMKDIHLTERIVVSRDICHGKPRIADTRIMVYLILDLLAAGKTPEDIISEDYYPDLTVEDVYACVTYASRVIQNDEFVLAE
jgi:uncharacterized protein (DUF433 family)